MFSIIFVFLSIGTEQPALKYLHAHLKANITDKWFDIGMQLFDVGDEIVLNTIQTNNSGDANKCTAEMLKLWLDRKPDANWNQLIQTLRMPVIGLNALALKIENMLTKGSQWLYY